MKYIFSFIIAFLLFVNILRCQITDNDKFFLNELENKYLKGTLERYFGHKINKNIFFTSDTQMVKYRIRNEYKDTCNFSNEILNKPDLYLKHSSTKYFSNRKGITLTAYYTVICGSYEYALFAIYDEKDLSGLNILFRRNIATGIIENRIGTFVY